MLQLRNLYGSNYSLEKDIGYNFSICIGSARNVCFVKEISACGHISVSIYETKGE